MPLQQWRCIIPWELRRPLPSQILTFKFVPVKSVIILFFYFLLSLATVLANSYIVVALLDVINVQVALCMVAIHLQVQQKQTVDGWWTAAMFLNLHSYYPHDGQKSSIYLCFIAHACRHLSRFSKSLNIIRWYDGTLKLFFF